MWISDWNRKSNDFDLSVGYHLFSQVEYHVDLRCYRGNSTSANILETSEWTSSDSIATNDFNSRRNFDDIFSNKIRWRYKRELIKEKENEIDRVEQDLIGFIVDWHECSSFSFDFDQVFTNASAAILLVKLFKRLNWSMPVDFHFDTNKKATASLFFFSVILKRTSGCLCKSISCTCCAWWNDWINLSCIWSNIFWHSLV